VASSGLVLGGTAAYAFSLPANVQEIIFELVDKNGTPITGATVLCTLRTTPGAKIFDWSSTTFKTTGWTTIAATMSEVDAIHLPGIYKQEVDVSAFANGRYQAFMSYQYVEDIAGVPTTRYTRGAVEFAVDEGQLIDEYTAARSHQILLNTDVTTSSVLAATNANVAATVAAIKADPITGTLTQAQMWRLIAASLAGNARGAGTGLETFRDPTNSKDVFRFIVDGVGNRTLQILDVN
jgi:hypothetical protein